MPSSEPDSNNYQQKYCNLKRKLKILIYENECFQEELKKSQRKLLKVSRDKSFLLDRLMKYENVESSSSDSEATVSSDSDNEFRTDMLTLKKKRNVPLDNDVHTVNFSTNHAVNPEVKKKKNRKTYPAKPGSPLVHVAMVSDMAGQSSSPDRNITSNGSGISPGIIFKGMTQPPPQQTAQILAAQQQQPLPTTIAHKPNVVIETLPASHDGHMTSEEIERHLEAKQSLRDLIPEKTPLTVPVELFSNEPSVME